MFVVKVPGLDGEGKTKGCEKAGIEVLKSLKELSFNEEGEEIDTKKLDLEEIHLDNSNLELSNRLIYKNAFNAFEEKPKTIFLGGDHSITHSLVKSFFDYCGKEHRDPCLIVFDSTPNLKSMDKEGYPSNHCWLRSLIELGFPPKNILLVGIRNFNPEEIEFMHDKKIRNISMNQILEDISDTADIITEFSRGRELYVSIDFSFIDPVFAPGVLDSNVGGVNSREFIYLIQRVNKIKNLRAIDLVEINPEKDSSGKSVKLGAKILGELV